MLNNITLEQASQALNVAVAEIGGIASALAACDRMYSQNFRTESFPLTEIIFDSLSEKEEFLLETKQNLIIAMYNIDTPCEYEFESLFDSSEYKFNRDYPDFSIDDQTLFVLPCNYKGEREEAELYILNKDLPIFKSKSESFNQANNPKYF